MREWDRNHESIGSYCQNLEMTLSKDCGQTWKKFVPGSPRVYLKGMLLPKKTYREFICKEDWTRLSDTLTNMISLSNAGKVLMEARNHYEAMDNPTYAFVLGISALELSIEELLSYKKQLKHRDWFSDINRKSMQEFNKPFSDLAIANKVRMLGNYYPIINQWMDDCARAVKTRNRVVHRGLRLQYNSENEMQFSSLVYVVGHLIVNPIIKYPIFTGLNTVLAQRKVGTKHKF